MTVTARFVAAVSLALGCAAVGHAADIIDNVPFSINSPVDQPLNLPQFDPALGTLTDASITLSGTVQDVVQISNTGSGPFDVRLQDFINVGSLQARIPFPVGGFIPNNTPVYAFLLPPTQFATSVSIAGQFNQFTGLGTQTFNIFALNPEQQILQGPTITSVFSSLSATGNVSLHYTYTPAVQTVTAAPEPSAMAGCAVALLFGLWRLRKPGAHQ